MDQAAHGALSIEELFAVLKYHRIDPEPRPAPLPAHCAWTPETDLSYPRFIAQGVDHADAVTRIEKAIRWAVRFGCFHVDAAGNLVREFDPIRLARPAEMRPA